MRPDSRDNLSELRRMSVSMRSLNENDRKIYSKNDLNTRLSEIQSALKEKERDLSLAAEIGQQLLEANTELKKNYEELFLHNQDVQNKLQIYEQLTTVYSGRSSPLQSNSNPPSPRYSSMNSRKSSIMSSNPRRRSRNLSLPPSIMLDGTGNNSPSSTQARSPNSSENDIVGSSNASLKDQQYLEKIKNLEDSIINLERHNEELKKLLVKKNEEVNDIQIQNNKLLLVKDGEVFDLKQELETLMIKTKKLEMEKNSLTKENQRQANELDRIEIIDQEYIQDLLNRINRLDTSLKRMETTKEELEKSIENITIEKIEYQNKCKTLDKKLQDYLYYKHLHDTQAQHIQELNQTIEQQRMQIQNLDFQLYNLSLCPFESIPEIKYTDKYILENPASLENFRSSTSSLSIKFSCPQFDSEKPYDQDTIVITAKRSSNATTATTNNNNNSCSSSVQASQSLPNSDPDLTLSTTCLGRRSLYSELEGTDWYNKKGNGKGKDSIDDDNPCSFSEEVLSDGEKLLKSGQRQPDQRQYDSASAISERKQSNSNNNEALDLVDKANQSFANNNNIEKIIKPQMLNNDVNSYEVLVNSIENEFKNSEEIKMKDDPSSSTNRDVKGIGDKDESSFKENNNLNNTTISSIKSVDTSEVSNNNDSTIDDTTNENNQSDRSVSNNNNNNSSNNDNNSINKSADSNLSNPKTLDLIKNSINSLFDYKKLTDMFEKGQFLNFQGNTNSNGVKRSASDDIYQKPFKSKNPFTVGNFHAFSFDSLFRAHELSKLQRNNFIVDPNYTNSNSHSKNNEKNKKINSDSFTPINGNSAYTTDANTNPNNPNSSSSLIIQDRDNKDNNKEGNSNTNLSPYSSESSQNLSSNTKNKSGSKSGIDDTSKSNLSSLKNNPMFGSHKNNKLLSSSQKMDESLISKEGKGCDTQTNTNTNTTKNNPINPVDNDTNSREIKAKSKDGAGAGAGTSTSSLASKNTNRNERNIKNNNLLSSSQKMDESLISKEGKGCDTQTNTNTNTTKNNPINPVNNDTNSREIKAKSKDGAGAGAGTSTSSLASKNTNKNERNININSNSNANNRGNNSRRDDDLINMLKGKHNQMMEGPGTFNGKLPPMMGGPAFLRAEGNTPMNNEAMIEQYRRTLNQYSDNGSYILRLLIDSWLRFLNTFVGYGSNINYDINDMDSAYARGYDLQLSQSSLTSEDSLTTTEASSIANSAIPSAASSYHNLNALP